MIIQQAIRPNIALEYKFVDDRLTDHDIADLDPALQVDYREGRLQSSAFVLSATQIVAGQLDVSSEYLGQVLSPGEPTLADVKDYLETLLFELGFSREDAEKIRVSVCP